MAKTTTAVTDKSTGGYTTKVAYSGKLARPKTPAEMRAISLATKQMETERDLAKEWLAALKKYEAARAEIEKLTAEAESLFFKTEKEIDEYVLTGLLAKEGYAAHLREWTDRKAHELNLINGVTDQEIRVNAQTYADKMEVWIAKADSRIGISKAKTAATIADIQAEMIAKSDQTYQRQQAIAKRQATAFIRGEDMDTIELMANPNRGNVALLDRFTLGFGK